jgi:uncharacterized protein
VTSPSRANSSATGAPSPVFRSAGISYLHIPSNDPKQSASFYQRVFGWRVQVNTDDAGFEDGTGHVIGAWVKDRSPSGDAGVLPYVYVESVDQVLERVSASGRQVVRAPYAEGDLRVATFRDPFGTVVGIWQRAST